MGTSHSGAQNAISQKAGQQEPFHFHKLVCAVYIVRKALATKLFQLRLGERHDAAYALLITGALVVVGWPGAVVWGAVVGSRVRDGQLRQLLSSSQQETFPTLTLLAICGVRSYIYNI